MKLDYKYPEDLVDISKIPRATILRDWFDEGLRIIVLRSIFSMNVYIGVPVDHPLAGHDYDSLPVACHGGLTYSAAGTGDLPDGYWWYGYDYAHAGDYVWYDSGLPIFGGEDHKWSLREIVEDAWSAIYDMRKLVRLAEKIKGGLDSSAQVKQVDKNSPQNS